MATSPRHFGGGDAGRAEALRRAEACCVPPPLPPERRCECGELLRFLNQTKCGSCQDADIVAKATVVDYDGSPLCIVGTDTFFYDIESAEETHAGQWAHPCDSELLHVDPKRLADALVERAIEDMCEEAFEDAEDHVIGAEALGEAIEAALIAFNKAQTASSWTPDVSKVVQLSSAPTEPGAQL
ncbi:hypothetical protein [Sphingomonas sp. MMS24-J13]|uniref:hypothetical protein n=1 Tax=Sphingomonas sp. MMS24-J13 TaxID=3238686 RepID=UPI00384C5E5A